MVGVGDGGEVGWGCVVGVGGEVGWGGGVLLTRTYRRVGGRTTDSTTAFWAKQIKVNLLCAPNVCL